jgi:hypothetical protein
LGFSFDESESDSESSRKLFFGWTTDLDGTCSGCGIDVFVAPLVVMSGLADESEDDESSKSTARGVVEGRDGFELAV